MQPNEALDPCLAAELQSRMRDCDIIYAEQIDTPSYDYLAVSVGPRGLRISERLNLEESCQDIELTASVHERIASITTPQISFEVPHGAVLGGTWACIFLKGEGPLRCFKVESATEADRVAFEDWVHTVSSVLMGLNVGIKGDWFVSSKREASCQIVSANPLIVDMSLPLRVRAVAARMGLKRANDFAGIRASEIMKQLDVDHDEKAAMLEELTRELGALGISMIH